MNKDIAQAIKELEDKFGGEGRVLIRPSGTEPLVRVMVEAQDEAVCRSCVDRVVNVIKLKGYTL